MDDRVSAMAALVFGLYFVSAFSCSCVVISRMANAKAINASSSVSSSRSQRYADDMIWAMRIGLLILSIGTALDNARTMFGAFPNIEVDNFANNAVSWICVLGHQVFTAICVLIPIQFMQIALKGQAVGCSRMNENANTGMGDSNGWERRLRILGVMLVCILLVIGLGGFLVSLPNPLESHLNQACKNIGEPVVVLSTVKSPPTELISVFVFSFLMVISSIVLLRSMPPQSQSPDNGNDRGQYNIDKFFKFFTLLGCGSWYGGFVVINVICLIGQALVSVAGNSDGFGYACFASNFFEQVLTISIIVVDGVLNSNNQSNNNAIDSANRGRGSGGLAENDYEKKKEKEKVKTGSGSLSEALV